MLWAQGLPTCVKLTRELKILKLKYEVQQKNR